MRDLNNPFSPISGTSISNSSTRIKEAHFTIYNNTLPKRKTEDGRDNHLQSLLEENELTNLFAVNMTIQDYIILKLTNATIAIHHSRRTCKALKIRFQNSMQNSRTSDILEIWDESFMRHVKLLADIFYDLSKQMPESTLGAETVMIEGITRIQRLICRANI